jgi:TRAP-type C4-dicarboxylate transport system permease small subunit
LLCPPDFISTASLHAPRHLMRASEPHLIRIGLCAVKSILDVTRNFSRALTWFGGVLLIGSALLVTVDVITRKFLNVTLGGADELSGYAFCMATALALSYALFERAHIRVDFLYRMFPDWLRRFADVLGLLMLLGFAVIATMMIFYLVADTYKFGSRSITPLRTPLIYPQVVWLFGWAFFCFTCLLLAVATLQRIVVGDGPGAAQIAGVKSLDEQISDEAPDARKRPKSSNGDDAR